MTTSTKEVELNAAFVKDVKKALKKFAKTDYSVFTPRMIDIVKTAMIGEDWKTEAKDLIFDIVFEVIKEILPKEVVKLLEE